MNKNKELFLDMNKGVIGTFSRLEQVEGNPKEVYVYYYPFNQLYTREEKYVKSVKMSNIKNIKTVSGEGIKSIPSTYIIHYDPDQENALFNLSISESIKNENKELRKQNSTLRSDIEQKNKEIRILSSSGSDRVAEARNVLGSKSQRSGFETTPGGFDHFNI